MIRIMVIDDQAVVRQGFVSLINTVADMEVIAQGVNGQQALELYRQHQPDITLMDLRMPVLGGVDAIAQIRREFPNARIIVLTTYDGDEDIYRALQAGAHGQQVFDGDAFLFCSVHARQVLGEKRPDVFLNAFEVAALQSDADERRQNALGGGF